VDRSAHARVVQLGGYSVRRRTAGRRLRQRVRLDQRLARVGGSGLDLSGLLTRPASGLHLPWWWDRSPGLRPERPGLRHLHELRRVGERLGFEHGLRLRFDYWLGVWQRP